MRRLILLLMTHAAAFVAGIAGGIYLLPILTAPDSPEPTLLEASAREAQFTGELTRDLRGSDLLHWGEGTISVGPSHIVHEGRLAPGPDYRAYLVKQFVEDEAEFLAVKDTARQIGPVNSFEGFLLDTPEGVNVEDYNTVVIWCEAFGEFITATKYR